MLSGVSPFQNGLQLIASHPVASNLSVSNAMECYTVFAIDLIFLSHKYPTAPISVVICKIVQLWANITFQIHHAQ